MNDKKDSFTISNCLVISKYPERGLCQIPLKLKILLVLHIIISSIFTFIYCSQEMSQLKLKNNIQQIKEFEFALIDLRIGIG